jgi:hypothetical protein
VGKPELIENVGEGASEVFVFVGVADDEGVGVPPLAAISCFVGNGRLGLPDR